MAQDILITPSTGEPEIKFTASGSVSDIYLRALSGVQPNTGIVGTGVTQLLYEGTQGTLLQINDNLSSGALFSVADIAGLPFFEVNASGDAYVTQFGNNFGIGTGNPQYPLHVIGTISADSLLMPSGSDISVYNSGTEADGNYERLNIAYSGNVARIQTQSAGTGDDTGLLLNVPDGQTLYLRENNQDYVRLYSDRVKLYKRLGFNGTTLDIGQTGGSESPRNVYIQDDVFLGFDGSGAINVYEDYTSSSNYARFLGTWDSNKFTMKAETDGTNGTQGRIFFQANTATNVPVSVQGAASQSANLTEFQNSAGDVVASIDNVGAVASTGGLQLYTSTYGIDDTNYERANMGWFNNNSDFRIYSEAGGSGTVRSISFFIGSTNKLEIGSTWVDVGSLRPDTNGTRYLGDAASLWDRVYSETYYINGNTAYIDRAGSSLYIRDSSRIDLNINGTNKLIVDNNGMNYYDQLDLNSNDIVDANSVGIRTTATSEELKINSSDDTSHNIARFNTSGGDARFQFFLESDGSASLYLGGSSQTILKDGGTSLLTHGLSVTGLVTAATGITLQRNTPETTTDKLYNVGGSLYFNGSEVGGGGGSVTGVPSGIAFFGSDSGVKSAGDSLYYDDSASPFVKLRATGEFIVDGNALYFQYGGATRVSISDEIKFHQKTRPSSDATYSHGTSSYRWSVGYYDQIDQEIHTASDVGHVIKGAASQSADLAQYQNSAGTVLTKIESDGSIHSESGTLTMGSDIVSSGTLYSNTLRGNTSLNIYNKSGGANRIQMGNSDTTFYQPMRAVDGIQPNSDNLSTAPLGKETTRWRESHITSGIFYSGIELKDATPPITTNVLYNVGGVLHFNGSGVAGSGGGGTTYTAGSGLTLDGTEFNVNGGTGQFVDLTLQSDGVDDLLTMISTDDGSSAAPVISTMRDSASPADGDYLGQLKFKGRSDAGTERVYAKITGKTLDVTNGTEDGLIEFTVKADGSNKIVSRFRNDGLRILNDADLYIQDNGSLGVRVSPSYSLHVKDDAYIGSGLILADVTPASTTNKLYNVGGVLHFNGSGVAGSGGGGTTYTAGTGLTLVGDEFNMFGTGALTQLDITQTTPASTPLTINGAASQSANYLTFKNSDGTIISQVNADGHVHVGSGTHNDSYVFNVNSTSTTNAFVINDSNGRIGMGTSSLSSTLNIGGDRILNFVGGNANLRADGGFLSIRAGGSSYSSHVFNGDTIRFAGYDGAGQFNMRTANTGRRTFVLGRLTSQTADLFHVKDESSNELFSIDSDGDVAANGSVDVTGLITAATGMTLQRNTPAATTDKLYNVGGSLYFNGSAVAGSSTDEWQDVLDRGNTSSGTILTTDIVNSDTLTVSGVTTAANIRSTGDVHIGTGTQSSTYRFRVHADGRSDALSVVDANGRVCIGTTSASTSLNIGGSCGIKFFGANATIDTDSSNVLTIRPGGTTAATYYSTQIRYFGFDAGAQFNYRSTATARRTSVIEKLTSQTADLFLVRDENYDPYFTVHADGEVSSTGLITAATGITLQRNTPATTTDTLYNVGGSLYFNGSAVGGGGGTLAVADGGTNATSFADKSVIISQDSGTDTLSALPLTTNGHIVIGGTSGPTAANITAADSSIQVNNGDGTISLQALGGGGGPSDQKLKDNIEAFDKPLEKVCELDAVKFEWNDNAKEAFNREGSDIGLIAQEVEKVIPEVIGENKDYKTIQYDKLTTVLIGAVKELKEQVETLQQEIRDLKNEN